MIQQTKSKVLTTSQEVLAEVRIKGKLLMQFLRRSESHIKFDGTASKEAKWLLVDRVPSVAILVCDRRHNLILVEQFRAPEMVNTLEIPAGSMEKGGDALATAIEEVQQETGLEVKELLKVGEFILSPGGSSEKISIFFALVDDLGQDGELNGLAEENENIKKHIVPFSEAKKMCQTGQLYDAKTVLALQWFELNRI